MTKIYLKHDVMDKPFKITSVAREDLLNVGFTEAEAKTIPDWKMKRIAEKMANAYVENSFWIDLEIIAKDIIIET